MLSPPAQAQIKEFYGAEIWGEIGFMSGSKENTADEPNNCSPNLRKIELSPAVAALQMNLLAKHRSQVEGAMDYVAAFEGRQGSRNVLENPFGTSESAQLIIAVDLMGFLREPNLEIGEFQRREVTAYLERLTKRTAHLTLEPLAVAEAGATAEKALGEMTKISMKRA